MSEPILENAQSAGTPCAIGPGAAFDGILSFWGLARVEGKEYIMQDGDVVDFRFNV